MGRKLSYWTIVFGSCVILTISCVRKDEPPSYIQKIPLSESYQYVAQSSWNDKSGIDTLVVKSWLSPEKADSAVLRMPVDIAEVNGKYWICDPGEGAIYEFSKEGEFHQTIARKGKGPNEVDHPSSIYVVEKEGKKSNIYVIDSGGKSVIIFDQNGNELKRFHHKTIDRDYFSNWLIVLSDNRFIWPTYTLEDYMLVDVDTSGTVNRSFIHRIIPMGNQPTTHNGVVYDIDQTNNWFAYAYRGLPILFTEKGKQKNLINLLPFTDLREVNTPLTKLPGNKRVTVKHLIKDLFIFKGKVTILFKNNLIVSSSDGEQVKGFRLKNEQGQEIGIHKMALAGDKLFFINRSTLRIYQLSLDSIKNLSARK